MTTKPKRRAKVPKAHVDVIPGERANALVALYRKQGWGTVIVHSLTVAIDHRRGDPEGKRVTLNWPALGEQSLPEAAAFAAELTEAVHVAIRAERLLAEEKPYAGES